jgi:hypothetical protein
VMTGSAYVIECPRGVSSRFPQGARSSGKVSVSKQGLRGLGVREANCELRSGESEWPMHDHESQVAGIASRNS